MSPSNADLACVGFCRGGGWNPTAMGGGGGAAGALGGGGGGVGAAVDWGTGDDVLLDLVLSSLDPLLEDL